MTEIIPGILAQSLIELKEKLKLLSWAKKVHIDIMDGRFVPNRTIQADTLRKILPEMDMQIHLMAYKPHKYVNTFARMGAKELIFHAEATDHATEILEDIRQAEMKAGIAFNPSTRIDRHALIHADMALVMTVNPGFSGQSLMKAPLRKISEIKKCNPVIHVGVDGGVNHQTCKFAASAGADFAVATSAISESENPKKTYKEMTKKCK